VISPAFTWYTWLIVPFRRTLTKYQQLDYIKAFKCLQSKPARTQSLYPGALTRYDDYVALHIAMTTQIHFVGQFLPWHRQFLSIFEDDLRETCCYEGALPYWDWSKDVTTTTSFNQSPIFDPVYGFGGNGEYIADISNVSITAALEIPGRTGGGCITTGPWAGINITLGPDYNFANNPRCLRRDFTPAFAHGALNTSVVAFTEAAPTFFQLDRRMQSLELDLAGVLTHGGGHFGVGGMVGEMSDMYSSPGDPLFWLHHAMLDNIWNTWQRANWTTRKSEVGGPDTMWAYPYNYFGDIPYKNITTAFVLAYGEISTNVTIKQIMDTTAGPISSYTYA